MTHAVPAGCPAEATALLFFNKMTRSQELMLMPLKLCLARGLTGDEVCRRLSPMPRSLAAADLPNARSMLITARHRSHWAPGFLDHAEFVLKVPYKLASAQVSNLGSAVC